MKIGIIGYRNHTSKHINSLVDSKLVSNLLVYVYKTKIINRLKNKNPPEAIKFADFWPFQLSIYTVWHEESDFHV